MDGRRSISRPGGRAPAVAGVLRAQRPAPETAPPHWPGPSAPGSTSPPSRRPAPRSPSSAPTRARRSRSGPRLRGRPRSKPGERFGSQLRARRRTPRCRVGRARTPPRRALRRPPRADDRRASRSSAANSRSASTAAGDLLSIGGELEPDGGIDTTPAVSAAAAARRRSPRSPRDTGVPRTAASGHRARSSRSTTRGSSAAPGIALPRAVWRIEVDRRAGPVTVRNLVLVDAGLGNVALDFSEIEGAKNRIVCNAESEPKLVPCIERGSRTARGGRPDGWPPPKPLTAYDLTGDLYDFYKENFGRDSIDGAGMPLVSTVELLRTRRMPVRKRLLERRTDGLRRRPGHRRRHRPRAHPRRQRLRVEPLLLLPIGRPRRGDRRHLRRALRPQPAELPGRMPTNPPTAGRSARTRASARSATCPTLRPSGSRTGRGPENGSSTPTPTLKKATTAASTRTAGSAARRRS